jgi:hypothetical protein
MGMMFFIFPCTTVTTAPRKASFLSAPAITVRDSKSPWWWERWKIHGRDLSAAGLILSPLKSGLVGSLCLSLFFSHILFTHQGSQHFVQSCSGGCFTGFSPCEHSQIHGDSQDDVSSSFSQSPKSQSNHLKSPTW